jgi:amino acid transporter
MFPESGGMVRYGQYSHGTLVGFIAAWANWIAIASVIPVEAEASVQYMASWPWQWAQDLYQQAPGGMGTLSTVGLGFAAVLMVGYFLLNYWSVNLFAKTNTGITIYKLIVPALTAVALLATSFHPENFHVGIHGGSHAFNFSAILTAVAISGIVFSYNGFQSPVNLAGEAKNPGRNVPLGVIGSILLATIVYLLLQVAFLGAMDPVDLAKGGWYALDFSSPFAQLALALNLNWLALLLYSDAFISPSGTGATYTATTARMLYGMQRNGTLPKIFGRVHPRFGIPRPAMWLNLVVAFIFLFFFRGWATLAEVISVATIISYLTGPVSVSVLRRTAPNLIRPLKIPLLPIIAGLAFVFATELLYWARWPRTGEIILLMVVALPVWFWYAVSRGGADLWLQVRGAAWLIFYLPAIALLSWGGSTKFGGHGYLPYGWDLVIVAVIAVAFFIWGLACGWATPEIEAIKLEAREHPGAILVPPDEETAERATGR